VAFSAAGVLKFYRLQVTVFHVVNLPSGVNYYISDAVVSHLFATITREEVW